MRGHLSAHPLFTLSLPLYHIITCSGQPSPERTAKIWGARSHSHIENTILSMGSCSGPDFSEVWIDASSSFFYPLVFLTGRPKFTQRSPSSYTNHKRGIKGVLKPFDYVIPCIKSVAGHLTWLNTSCLKLHRHSGKRSASQHTASACVTMRLSHFLNFSPTRTFKGTEDVT